MNFDLIGEFYKEMSIVDLNVFGILDNSSNILTLGTDSKIIGRIFEMITEPILKKIARNHNYTLSTPNGQNIYPDFIMIDKISGNRIAIDVKTTYRSYGISGNLKNICFTLGSYASYMRDNKKNIDGLYTDYSKHFVIGFIYDRNGKAQQSDKYPYEERFKIETPYKNVEYFIQEKYKIAGEKPGSGNTENIGSIKSNNFLDFYCGNGPFNTLGDNIFNPYWSYYPKYRAQNKDYTNLNEFIRWYRNQNNDLPVLYDKNKKYLYNENITILNEYEKNNKI